jgi:membrane associated rhomboid family serine protease
MTSGADLFVVCKHCGSEVSPYITECPYCGTRLRRRAPKLPKVNAPSQPPASERSGLLTRLRSRTAAGSTRTATARRSDSYSSSSRWELTRPYATIAIVAATAVMWVLVHAKGDLYLQMAVIGPLHGEWWKLLTSQFAYLNGVYGFLATFAVAIFGTLLERRHGPALVLALFFGAGAAGALAAIAAYPLAIDSGANAGALALLAAWAAPDIRAARAGDYYEGDLLGTAAIAALLLALPFARPEASWLAGIVGGAIGLLAGVGISAMASAED